MLLLKFFLASLIGGYMYDPAFMVGVGVLVLAFAVAVTSALSRLFSSRS